MATPTIRLSMPLRRVEEPFCHSGRKGIGFKAEEY